MFQSTHPHGVRQRSPRLIHNTDRFNPRTHTGCDQSSFDCFRPIPRFNPRTHTGCDQKLLLCLGSTKRFNPRTHTGCDLSANTPLSDFVVSIHAPTRGATFSLLNSLSSAALFQSTHPHGVRQAAHLFAKTFNKFQSTHPHGVRPSGSSALSGGKLFQSTHPHGVRLAQNRLQHN